MNAEVGFMGTYCRANNTFQDLVLTLSIKYKIKMRSWNINFSNIPSR